MVRISAEPVAQDVYYTAPNELALLPLRLNVSLHAKGVTDDAELKGHGQARHQRHSHPRACPEAGACRSLQVSLSARQSLH